jgi:peptidoglycan/xylan/chitin deacetylase (PgdA/CDA1 family)
LHENFSALSPEAQRETLKQSEAALELAFGKRPIGWRAPYGLMSLATRGLLLERGYRFDSSFCDDDVPYVVQNEAGDRLVELPVFPAMGDRHYYLLRRAPEIVAQGWREEFDAMYSTGGLFNLNLRPRGDFGSGRAVRIRAVEAILQHIAHVPDVWMTTCDAITAWALESLPVSVSVE